MLRSARTAAVAAVRRLDHAVHRRAGGRARVLIDVRTPMNLAVLAPIWRCLRADPRVEVRFAAEDATAVSAALDAAGVRGSFIDSARAARARWDLSVVADAWNHTPLTRCRRCIQFFHGVAGKYDLDDPRKLAAAGLSRFDRIAFINEDRLDRYVASGVIRPEQAVLVGYPKSDDLFNGAWPAQQIRSTLGLDAAHPTVLYAPTFSTASSLHAAGIAIVDALLASGVNVIVKLHDRSMRPDPRHTDNVDWPAELARFASHPRFALAAAADAGPFLSAADVLVTDHSTVGFEFAMLDRPIVVFDAPALRIAARIDDDKWSLLRSMADVVTTAEEVGSAVTRALERPEGLRQERLRARALFAYAGRATDRALEVVYELLEVPPHARRAPASAAAATPPSGGAWLSRP